jgi:hypothetical protein
MCLSLVRGELEGLLPLMVNVDAGVRVQFGKVLLEVVQVGRDTWCVARQVGATRYAEVVVHGAAHCEADKRIVQRIDEGMATRVPCESAARSLTLSLTQAKHRAGKELKEAEYWRAALASFDPRPAWRRPSAVLGGPVDMRGPTLSMADPWIGGPVDRAELCVLLSMGGPAAHGADQPGADQLTWRRLAGRSLPRADQPCSRLQLARPLSIPSLLPAQG